MKKIVSLFLVIITVLAIGTTTLAINNEEVQSSIGVHDISGTGVQEENQAETSDKILLQQHGLVEYISSAEISQAQYLNLPDYAGEYVTKEIDPTELASLDFEANSTNLSRYIASIYLTRVSSLNDGLFALWNNSNLTTPTAIYQVSGAILAYAYGVVDGNNKLVGYIVTGACDVAPPVLEFSTAPEKFIAFNKAEKVYFDRSSGYWIEDNDSLYSLLNNDRISSAEKLAYFAVSDTAAKDNITGQWNEMYQLAEQYVDSAGNIELLPQTERYVTSTVRLPIDTSDYTWQTLCTYTTLAMYFDAIGRRIEPCLLGTDRPHSIKLNVTMHGYCGHSPTFTEIKNDTVAYANSNKASTALTFSGYLVSNDNASCFTTHKARIDSGLPTMVGYSYDNPDIEGDESAHIMMGIGYTTGTVDADKKYIVRDTWTNDAVPMRNFYYDTDFYSFYVLGLTYSNTNSATAWCTPTLRLGDNNLNVKRLRYMLNALFYDVSCTSTYFDADLETAVKAFQSDYGLTADGIVGSGTYTKLKSAHIMKYDAYTSNWRILSQGKKGDDVAQLQLRLYRLGYYNGVVDGIFGTDTKDAVEAYQAAKSLTVDGQAGSATLAKLYGTSDSYSRAYLPCYTCTPQA